MFRGFHALVCSNKQDSNIQQLNPHGVSSLFTIFHTEVEVCEVAFFPHSLLGTCNSLVLPCYNIWLPILLWDSAFQLARGKNTER